LNVENQVSTRPVQSPNVIGEIPGGEHPEQIVLLAAHLDSWDLGTGVVDDGFGVASVLGAAEAILRSGATPRRTIRVVLFTGEEQGLLGSRAYVKAHQSEISHFLCSLALDWGRGPVMGISVAGHDELIAPLEQLMRVAHVAEPIKISPRYMQFTDSFAFTLAGVPGIAFAQEVRDSSMLGHSAADTLDKVDRDTLIKTAALSAQVAFWIANHPTRLGTVWSAAETAQALRKDKQQNLLESFGLWPFTQR
jgi:Zn-dependent M28 family amino/carboxypeptidase